MTAGQGTTVEPSVPSAEELVRPVQAQMLVPGLARAVDLTIHFAFWGVLLWVATLAALQVFLLPLAPPPQRAIIALLVVLPVIGLWTWQRFRSHCFRVEVGDEMVFLYRGRGVEVLPASDVLALCGRAGVDLHGGDMIVWKRLVLVTRSGWHALAFEDKTNALWYQILRRACPVAWGLPFRGTVEPPLFPSADLNSCQESLSAMHRYCLRGAVRSAAWGLLLPAGSVILAVAMAMHAPFDDRTAKGYLIAIVMFVIGLLYLGETVRQIRALAKIRHAKRLLAQSQT